MAHTYWIGFPFHKENCARCKKPLAEHLVKEARVIGGKPYYGNCREQPERDASPEPHPKNDGAHYYF